ncbi:MAG: hypothetical protein SGARI_007357 [Bacillariaceae sp.]
MTPLSNVRGTFGNYYGNGGANGFSEFSPEDNINLNKALFAEDDGRKGTAPKTPISKTPAMTMKFGKAINSSCIKNMKVNRVSISPVATKNTRLLASAVQTAEKPPKSAFKEDRAPGTVSRSIHFADDHEDSYSAPNSMYKLMSTEYYSNDLATTTPYKDHAQTPMNMTQSTAASSAYSGISPFAGSLTPMGGYDWERQLGFSPNSNMGASFTPFRSPGLDLGSSIKKSASRPARSPLGDISKNLAASKPESELKRPSQEDDVSPSKRQRTDASQSLPVEQQQ